MKRIFSIFSIVMLAFAFAACDQLPGIGDNGENNGENNGNTAVNNDIEFTFVVDDVTGTTASVEVTHNGKDGDTWYGFHVEKTSNIDNAIADKIEELLKADKISGLKRTTLYLYNLQDLKKGTDYTFIAFGLTEEGKVYGLPKSINFTTTADLTENTAWTVSYTGKQTIGEDTYDHTVSVASTDENTYFITVVDKESFDYYGIEKFASDELLSLKEFITSYNQANSTNLTIQDMLYKGNGIDAFNLYAGEWIEEQWIQINWCGVAIGVNENGELSGYYALNEFQIQEEEPTPAYSSWIGNWTWTGENGVAFNVEFKKYISNQSYLLSGWEGDEAEGLNIIVEWDKENELWGIYTYRMGTYYFGENGEQEGIMWIVGVIGNNIYPLEGLPICMGGFTEENQRAAYPYTEETEDGGILSIEYMQFIADIEGQYYGVTATEAWPTFPITITENTNPEVAPTSVKTERILNSKELKEFTKAPRAIKFFYPINKNVVLR